MRVIASLFVIILGVCLAACSSGKHYSVDSQSGEFLKAKSIPNLKMPPGVSKPKYKTSYPVSDKQFNQKQSLVNLVPPGLYSK